MDPSSTDEGIGWAEFASFESGEPGFHHELSNDKQQVFTQVQDDRTFGNCVFKQDAADVFIGAGKVGTQPYEIRNSASAASLLLDCFKYSENEKLSAEKVVFVSEEENNLETMTEISSLWKMLQSNEEHFKQVIWTKSKLHQIFMKSMDKFLLKEDDRSTELLPEVLDLSLFIPCFNFHKFARKKNTVSNSRVKEQNAVSKNPASELNPFAPEKIQESDRCSSDSSICESASVSSFDLLSIKEAECSSTASIESVSSVSETNEENNDIDLPADENKDSLLEKWKQLKAGKNVHDSMKAEFTFHELESLFHELQNSCNRLSETLVKQLREKDELLREKQVRDDFISSLLTVSRKQKQQELSQTSKRKRILSHVLGHVETKENKFLDTSIPYFPTENGPSLPDIIALTSIFQAIIDEDPKVPGMVSNYILNALKQIQHNGGVS